MLIVEIVFMFVLMTTPAPQVLEGGLAGAGRVRVPGPLLHLLRAEPWQDGLQLRLAQDADHAHPTLRLRSHAHPTLRLQSHAPISPVQDQIFQTSGKTRKSSVIITALCLLLFPALPIVLRCVAGWTHHCARQSLQST